ncbi:hypothetical protein TIFTF001_039016 [Ficus carica]|uniref:Uncharacterized protein n=1 Tax=Ficus carica TaxID=3494 RepID=A0AA88E8S0_FICCA|nr:hypothetical protein TIFTF001_039016 [Ficus carica]
MLWMPARGLGSPPNLTAPRTTHAALRPGSRRRWPPRSSVVGRAYVRLCRFYPPPLVAASRLPDPPPSPMSTKSRVRISVSAILSSRTSRTAL